MTAIGAKQIGDGRGWFRHGWIPIVDDLEIRGVKFATKEEAVAYAWRVVEYEKQRAAAHNPKRKGTD